MRKWLSGEGVTALSTADVNFPVMEEAQVQQKLLAEKEEEALVKGEKTSTSNKWRGYPLISSVFMHCAYGCY